MAQLIGGKSFYGADLGIVLLDCRFPRPCGDIGNMSTFSFPVQYEVVEDVAPSALTQAREPAAVDHLIDAAKQLEQRGAGAILTSCGLLIPYQQKLTQTLHVPVASSALLMLPLISSMIAPTKKIGVVVSRMTSQLSNELKNYGGEQAIAVEMTDCPEFEHGIMSLQPPYSFDTKKIEQEFLSKCGQALSSHPDIGAFLLECTNLPPYSSALRSLYGLPVFDITQLATLLHSACATSF